MPIAQRYVEHPEQGPQVHTFPYGGDYCKTPPPNSVSLPFFTGGDIPGSVSINSPESEAIEPPHKKIRLAKRKKEGGINRNATIGKGRETEGIPGEEEKGQGSFRESSGGIVEIWTGGDKRVCVRIRLYK